MFSNALMLGVNHRLVSFLLLLLVTVVTASGLPSLRVDTGFGTLIADNDPDKLVYDRVSKEFGSDNRTIVYVKDSALWTADKLAALERLHYTLEGLDFVERVDDLFNLRSVRGSGGQLDSRALMTEAPKDPADIDRARKDALDNPLIVGNFISSDGTVTALMVSVSERREEEGFDHRVNDALERAIGPARSAFEEVFQVGPPRINAEIKASLFADLQFLGPLSALLLVTTILVFLRSVFAAAVPLITSALSIAWTFGMMGLVGIPVNILSAMLPSLVVVIGSTEDTHLMAAYFHGVSQAESDRRAFATRFMMKYMGAPLFLTVLTTGLGFASNIFSSIGLIQHFAVASAFAILANGIITILLVPMVLTLFGPVRTRLYRNKQAVSGLPGLAVTVFGFSNRHLSHVILMGTAILCGFFIYQASKLYVTNDPLSYFRGDRALVQESQRIQRDLSGMKVFFITLESDQEKAFQEPENIRKLVQIQDFVKKQEIFDRSISLADYLSLVNREFNGGDPEYFKVPDKRELVAQYLLFFHRRDVEGYVSHDLRRANILVRHNISDSRTLNSHIRELKQVVSKIAGGQVRGYVVGENLMINAAADTLVGAQARSLAILLFAIFIIMSAMFTSYKGGLVSLIPSLIPIILMFGVMGLLGIPLNPGTAMVAVIAIGIAIDGTIHLFSRYNELCRRSVDNEEAVQNTVGEEAIPVIATSLALALGFGVLLFSNFTIIAQFGALSAATMLFAVFANLLITPIIMSRIRLVGLYEILAMAMQRDVVENSPLFRDMSNYQIRKAILISERHEFEAGENLVEQGTVGRSMYLILSGQVEVLRHDGGKTLSLSVLDAGQVFGEIGFIRETERTADVRALSQVEVLRFDYEKLGTDLKFFPHIVAKLNFNISRILGERLADLTEEFAAQSSIKDSVHTAAADDGSGADSQPAG
jgi:predicted RND superfamily exporter protein/CRP-like cAMP-binding protein